MGTPLFVSDRPRPQITTRPLSVGCLIFPQMDQIDFTGPFEVLSRMPDTTVCGMAKEPAPVRDVQGLHLTPDLSIAEAGTFDVLLVPGGYGQQALMHDEQVLALIQKHAALVLVSLLRGDAAAQEIQLAIEYAPNPVFHSGTPDSAPPEVLQSFQKKYQPIGARREAEALRYGFWSGDRQIGRVSLP